MPTVALTDLIEEVAAISQPSPNSMNVEESLSPAETCGTLKQSDNPLPPAVVETMKIVFRETHGGEMTPEDREFLGIGDK